MTLSPDQIPWLPLAEAAEKISRSTGKPHAGSDVIAAALKGYITISKQINSPVPARAGQFQERYRDAPFGVSPKKLLHAGVGFWGSDGEVFAYASNRVEHVHGVFDMLLIGNGQGKIENVMHGITDDDDDEPQGGIYLQGPTGIIWEIQEEIETNGAHHSHDHQHEYIPAERFRDDWRIVVWTSELDKFTEHINQLADLLSRDHAEEILSDNQPPVDQGELVTEQDLELKALPGAFDKVIGDKKLCQAFHYNENSFSAVKEKLKKYNKRFPESPIEFKRINRVTPWLYQHEVQLIITKIGGCSLRRAPKKA